MTIGEKIRYCRKQLGITQERLAELSGIHHVSIRKYEINKMQPQPPQLERLAHALGVSYYALSGIDHAGMRLETVGDLLGLLMILCNANILQITGERGERHKLMKSSVSISVNPVLAPYLEITVPSQAGMEALSLEDTLLHIKNKQVMDQLLDWEKIDYLYHREVAAAGDHPNEATQSALMDLAETKEKIELELMRSQVRLTVSGKISVDICPN